MQMHNIVQHLSDPVFWLESYIHFLAICSALSRVLDPSRQWAQENLSPEKFKRYESFLGLLASYGALNPKAKPREIWDDATRMVQLNGKSDAAGAGK